MSSKSSYTSLTNRQKQAARAEIKTKPFPEYTSGPKAPGNSPFKFEGPSKKTLTESQRAAKNQAKRKRKLQ